MAKEQATHLCAAQPNNHEWRGGRQGGECCMKKQSKRDWCVRGLRQMAVRMAEQSTSTLRQREKEDVRSVPFSRSEGT
jgi:hypothetical protein